MQVAFYFVAGALIHQSKPTAHTSVADAFAASRAASQMIGYYLTGPFLILPALALVAIQTRQMWLLRLASGFAAFSLLGEASPLLLLVPLPLAMFFLSFSAATRSYFGAARPTPVVQR